MERAHTVRYHLLAFLSAILVMLAGGSQKTGAEEGALSLEPLISEALAQNPALLSKENQVSATGERIFPAGTLPDPMLKLALLNLPEKVEFNEDPMTQKQVAVTQKLPFPGKLGLKKAIAEDEYLQQKEEFSYQQLEIVNRVKVTYLSLFLIDKSIEITNRMKVLLEGFLEIARTRYSVGKGIQQDVMKAEVELSRLIERLITQKRQRTTVEAQMNTLLDRPPSEPLDGKPEVEKTSFEVDASALLERGLVDHPLLKSSFFIEERATDAFELAQREYYPDFEVGFSYSRRESSFGRDHPDFYSGFVGINLPIWFKSKQKRKVEEARYNKQSAENKYEAVKNDLEFRVSSLIAEIEQNSQLITLYRDAIIPQADHTLSSSVDSYQVGSVDFLTLLTNLQALYRYELEFYRVLVDYEKNLADLELAVGRRLF